MEYKVQCEATPNPQSLKFVVNKAISDEILEIKDRNQAARSPLAAKILGFPWAKSVFLGENFVTVTKEEWVEWDILSQPLAEMIEEHLQRGGKVLMEKPKSSNGESSEEDSEAVQKIKSILQKEIQPAVAMDGGYIEFVSYENNKVYLSMQGACAGCPSSSYTLKEGIETRLKQVLPEIEEVVSV